MSLSSCPLLPDAQRHLRLPTAPHPDTPSPRPSPDGRSPWIVTLRIRHTDGRHGTQSFTEWAPTASQATTSAVRRAATPAARLRRRDAVVETGATAAAELWHDFRSPTPMNRAPCRAATPVPCRRAVGG
ncbi:hypothetical protein [Kitasatospora sp. NPDC088346]|uniref:hypothetical protein n=1 Tax=Kitasatospora sp. NPDC088346 TaxID=3364073 RepID=UPI0038019425